MPSGLHLANFTMNACIALLDFDFAGVDALLLLSLTLGVHIAQLILQAVLKFHNHGQTTGHTACCPSCSV